MELQMNNMSKEYRDLIVKDWLAKDRGINPKEISDAEVAKCVEAKKFQSNNGNVIIHTQQHKIFINYEKAISTEVYLEYKGKIYYKETFYV